MSCVAADYTMWNAGKDLSKVDGMSDGAYCLLGRITKYQRRIPHAKCYNGQEYVRVVEVKNCACTREDFEWYILLHCGTLATFFSDTQTCNKSHGSTYLQTFSCLLQLFDEKKDCKT